MSSILDEPIGIIGAGAAGLITAHVLLQDGFTNVQLVTRDETVGGIWAKERIYPGLNLNNVHGEFRFSPLEMRAPENAEATGGRLSGEIMAEYMTTFAQKLIKDRVRFNAEVLDIRRGAEARWTVSVENTKTGIREDLVFARIVVCTGGCSTPKIPETLSQKSAEQARFRGMVLHSTEFGMQVHDILAKVKPMQSGGADTGSVVIVGGGKSAQDMSSYLANEGRKVTVVYETADAFLASPKPLPPFLRKGRLFSTLSPHIELRTRLERFFHTTWLGSKIVNFVWKMLVKDSFKAYGIPEDSPLRNTASLYWDTRTNDDGVVRDNSYQSLVKAGKIQLVTPARALAYKEDGRSLLLSNGQSLSADVVILATGYTSSWCKIFDEQTEKEVGLDKVPPQAAVSDTWDHYLTLRNRPTPHSGEDAWSTAIYRGIVPAKNIHKRDFAVNGAMFTTNNGYAFELCAHWISSYFLGDKMRIAETPEAAMADCQRQTAWWRKRFPGIFGYVNQSYSAAIQFWSWPQAMDQLLEDMYLPSMRSGGNWLTWPFQVIDLKEIATLGEERRVRRLAEQTA
ncbi:FAD/NAD-P-binding domain-containing protein [Crucibulum laeve]|uniref:FAD/NAD-P-binding domain-containing protein n=1 Tax=Crucibulum laeve TaxID=68775 RepID=A0A5C3M2A9_9AGAR|nr:FAD/NAD-P-binding domain-containing protein [Crucibulum laeve]